MHYIRIKWLDWLGEPGELNPCRPVHAILALPKSAREGAYEAGGTVYCAGYPTHYLTARSNVRRLEEEQDVHISQLLWVEHDDFVAGEEVVVIGAIV